MAHVSGIGTYWKRRPTLGQAGFSLIELMVLVAVISVVAAVAGTGYVAQLPESRLNGAARQMVGDMRLARSWAVTENKTYFGCVTSTTT
ncbi:MAG: Tfp pilus assembly protein FimT/FimU [Leptospirillia bacterium]